MDVRAEIIERLRASTVVDNAHIDDATELYGDLRLSGDDLSGFLRWVAKRFGLDLTEMNLSHYAPPDGFPLFERKHKSLTVRMILDAVARGTWNENPQKAPE